MNQVKVTAGSRRRAAGGNEADLQASPVLRWIDLPGSSSQTLARSFQSFQAARCQGLENSGQGGGSKCKAALKDTCYDSSREDQTLGSNIKHSLAFTVTMRSLHQMVRMYKPRARPTHSRYWPNEWGPKPVAVKKLKRYARTFSWSKKLLASHA